MPTTPMQIPCCSCANHAPEAKLIRLDLVLYDSQGGPKGSSWSMMFCQTCYDSLFTSGAFRHRSAMLLLLQSRYAKRLLEEVANT